MLHLLFCAIFKIANLLLNLITMSGKKCVKKYVLFVLNDTFCYVLKSQKLCLGLQNNLSFNYIENNTRELSFAFVGF